MTSSSTLDFTTSAVLPSGSPELTLSLPVDIALFDVPPIATPLQGGQGLMEAGGEDALCEEYDTAVIVWIEGQSYLPRDLIDPDPQQHRKYFDPVLIEELAVSIKAHGIIQPLAARPLRNGRFQLFGGERRWRASAIAGLTLLPVTISKVARETAYLRGVIENIQRKDPRPLEESGAYEQVLKDHPTWTVDDISREVGKSRQYIEYSLALLELHPNLQGLVSRAPQDGQISVRQAHNIVTCARATDTPFDTQFKILKGYQEGGSIEELCRAVRSQTAAKEQGLLFIEGEFSAFQQEVGQRERDLLKTILTALVKYCARSWNEKKCATIVHSFSDNGLERELERIELVEKHLARMRRDLTAERARRQLYKKKRRRSRK